MSTTTGIIGGSLVALAFFALGAAAGWYARGETPPPVVLDEHLQREVEYLRHENDRLRREVESQYSAR